MTKDVIISIKGMQNDFTNNESIEMITTGEYYYKQNKHYINYIDNDLTNDKETKTTLKISNNQIDIIRFGAANTHMIFEKDKKHMTHYQTPFGDFIISLKTKEINLNKDEYSLSLDVDYQLEINNNFIGENTFNLHVQSKKQKVTSLIL